MPDFFSVPAWLDIKAVEHRELFRSYEQAIVAKEHEPMDSVADERIAAMQSELLRRLRRESLVQG